MNREFLVNIIFLVAINLLIKPFYIFFIERDVQNVVGTSEYGIYFALLNLVLILEIVNDFGIRNFTSRYIAQNNHLLQKYFPDLLSLKIVLSLFYYIITLIIGWILGYLMEYFILFNVLIISKMITSGISFFRANIIGLAQYRSDSVLSVLHRLISIFLCGILLWIPSFRTDFSIEWFVYTELSALFITLLVAYFLLQKHLSNFRFRIHYQRILVFLRQSLPYALIVFLMMIYNRIDAVMLEQLLEDGKEQAGIYAASYRLLDAAVMFSFLFANLLLPMFSRMLKQKESINNLMKFTFELMMAMSISGVVAIYFLQAEIMELLYVGATPYWGDILGVLMWSFIAISATHVFGTALLANGNLRALNYLFVLGIIINILLNWYFIPIHKGYGAALTTCTTQFFVVLGEIYLVIRFFQLNEIRMWMKVFVFGISLFSLVHFGESLLNFDWRLKFGIIFLSGIGLAFTFRLLRLASIKMLFLNKE
ncbi:MAG: oligosaccharide flippase family protein [Bacteroidota bacterium]